MQNADMTFTQDLGAVTELLSGEFFQPFGRSSSHQLWSSAMVLTPALRGLFGLEADALHHILRVHPQLPASWETAALHNVPVGSARFDLHFLKDHGKLLVNATSAEDATSIEPQPLCLASTAAQDCTATTALTHHLELDLPPFEVELPHTLPTPGARTAFAKVLSQSDAGFDIEGQAGSVTELNVRFVRPPARIAGAALKGSKLLVQFPAGEGYKRVTVRFAW
jgi:hypothetical protein